jgi:hypothetical protein
VLIASRARHVLLREWQRRVGRWGPLRNRGGAGESIEFREAACVSRLTGVIGAFL